MVQQTADPEASAHKRATRKLLLAGIVCIALAVMSAAVAIAVILQENRDRRIPHTNYMYEDKKTHLKTENYESLVNTVAASGHFLYSSKYVHEMTLEGHMSSIVSNPSSTFSQHDQLTSVPFSYSTIFPSISLPASADLQYISTEIVNPSAGILYGSTRTPPGENIPTTDLSSKAIITESTSVDIQPFSTSDVGMLSSHAIYSSVLPTMTTDPHLMTEIFTNFSVDSGQSIFLFSNFTTNHNDMNNTTALDSSASNSELDGTKLDTMTSNHGDNSYLFSSSYMTVSQDLLGSVVHSAVEHQLSTEGSSSFDLQFNSALSATNKDTLHVHVSEKRTPIYAYSSTPTESINHLLSDTHATRQGISNSVIHVQSDSIELTNTEFQSMNSFVPFATSFKGSKLQTSLSLSHWWSSVESGRMNSVLVSMTESPEIFPDCDIGQYRCLSGQCVDASQRCDRVIHCEDMSDEINCSNCQGFQCNTGLCLWSWSVRCNEKVECGDLSDEIGCDYGPFYRSCDNGMTIPSHKWCDNVDNCFDNSDETNCTCSYKEVSCKDGRCIREEWVCDGHVDCTNSTDEELCDQCTPDQFVCGDYSCINMTQRCDGVPDCPGAEDETKCYIVSAGSPMTVQFKGDNFTVCSTHWHSGISDHICQLLGYKNSSDTSYIYSDDNFEKMELNQSLTDYKNILGYMNIRSSCTSNLTVSVSCMPRDCGLQSPDLMLPFVAGGDIAGVGQWPWVVSLSYLGRPFCSGTLVSSDWVVTAGHCVAIQGSFNYTETPQYVEVFLGTTKRLRNTGIAVRSDRIVHHPELRMSGIGPIYHDIALVHLSHPITFSDHISPVCLPNVDFSALSNCHIAGWGYIGSSQDVTVQDLRSAKLHVLSDEDCQRNTVHMEDKVNTNITYCTLYKFGTMSGCQGDSGSPLMCQDATDHWVLAGVMSSGVSGCGIFSSIANRFTRVPAMLDWVYSVMQG